MDRVLLPQGGFVSTNGSASFDAGGGRSVAAAITRAPVQHVVMLSYPRSGTGWLCDLMKQHPRLVLDPGEPMKLDENGANYTETIKFMLDASTGAFMGWRESGDLLFELNVGVGSKWFPCALLSQEGSCATLQGWQTISTVQETS